MSPVIRVFTANKTRSIDNAPLPGQLLPAVTPSSDFRSPQPGLNRNTNQDGNLSSDSNQSNSPMKKKKKLIKPAAPPPVLEDAEVTGQSVPGAKSVKIMVDRPSTETENSDYKTSKCIILLKFNRCVG